MATMHASPSIVTGETRLGPVRVSLKLDALASGPLGLLMAATGSRVGGLMGLPGTLLVMVGILLVAFAASLWYTATRPTPPRFAIGAIIAANVAWVVASVSVLVAGWFPLTALGIGFVLAQAAAVAALAAFQFVALRRAGSAVG
jgi:hypothetical protein